MIRSFALCLALAAAPALAQEDVASLYEVSTEGSTPSFKAGQKGKLVIELRTKGGAHIKGETPMKIELTGKDVTPEKTTLGYKDSVSKKSAGKEFPDPKFEVALSGATPARAQVDAKLTFFVCTDKLCSKQSKTLALPVEVQ
jgi:hypothetical protein